MKHNSDKKLSTCVQSADCRQTDVAGSADRKARQLADKWIKELQEIGCTPDEMLYIFREARKKYEQLKK